MNCRTFHKHLEDYLDGRLDFPVRFGIERHAQQCIACGKKMSLAQQLSGMVRELQRFKAPDDFDSAVLNRIGRESSDRCWRFRRLWIYGLLGTSWRTLVLAAAGFLLLGLAVLYFSGSSVSDEVPTWQIVDTPAPSSNQVQLESDSVARSGISEVVVRPPTIETAEEPIAHFKPDLVPNGDWTAEPSSEFVEYIVPGSDNRPTILRLPKRIRMEYGQPSEEYFIRNVSH